MAHVVTNRYSGTYAQIGGGLATYTVSVDTGTGTNRAILITFRRRNDRSPVVNSVVVGGESAAVIGSDIAGVTNTTLSSRSAVLLNPTVTGAQTLVITTTTNGSNSSSDLIVAVYDDVDPDATEADLLTVSGLETATTPWTSIADLVIPSATGEQAVVTMLGASNDASYNPTGSGYTSTLDFNSGGDDFQSGYASGAATVTCSWTITVLGQNADFFRYGWSLPAPGGGGGGGTPAFRLSLLGVGR